MWLVTFTGDPRRGGEGPPCLSLWGLVFDKGVAVETADPFVVAKARGNSHFTVRGKPGRRRRNGKDSE